MDAAECRLRFGAARVARLATVNASGDPHLVPITFVLLDDDVYSAVDTKPKQTTTLQRITNVRATGRACVLADHYAEDWAMLWWVRADAQASVLDESAAEANDAIEALVGKYPQYAAQRPPGPVIRLHVRRWVGWRAT
jgi:PPOX class probable F420-dependent enzyme